MVGGATHWQAFRQVCRPVAWPGVVAVGTLFFLFSWNELLFSLVPDALAAWNRARARAAMSDLIQNAQTDAVEAARDQRREADRA